MWYFFSNATRSHKCHADFFFNVFHPWAEEGILFLSLMRKKSKGTDQTNELVITLGLLGPETLPSPGECWMVLDWLRVSLLPVKPLNGVLGIWWCLHPSLANIRARGLFVPLSLSYIHLPRVFWGGKDGVSVCFPYAYLIVVWGHSVRTAGCYEPMYPELVSRQGCNISFEEFCTLPSLPGKSEAPYFSLCLSSHRYSFH